MKKVVTGNQNLSLFQEIRKSRTRKMKMIGMIVQVKEANSMLFLRRQIMERDTKFLDLSRIKTESQSSRKALYVMMAQMPTGMSSMSIPVLHFVIA